MLHDIREYEIQDDNGYDIFEPTISLGLEERNTFEAFGIGGVEHPVIMPSLENFLRETLKLVQHLNTQPTMEYRYWFHGTGFGLKLLRERTDMTLFLEVDGRWGPVQGLFYPQSKKVGNVTVREWVKAIVTLATNLLDLFKRLNPQTYTFLKELELKNHKLEEWLIV